MDAVSNPAVHRQRHSWGHRGLAGGWSDRWQQSVGTVTTAGLYTPPSTPGTHVVSAVSSDDSSFSVQAAVAVTDLAGVTTYHNDVARTGQNLQEYALTPATVSSVSSASAGPARLTAPYTRSRCYIANLAIAGGVHDVLFVSTEHDSIYAFNADDPNCGTFCMPFRRRHRVSRPRCSRLSGSGGVRRNAHAGNRYDFRDDVRIGGHHGERSFVQRLHAINIATGVGVNAPVQIQGLFPARH